MVMKMVDNLTERLTIFIKCHLDNISEEKEEIIKYGISIFIYESFLLFLVFTLAFIFGVVKLVLASFLVYGILRISTGGAHARTRFVCGFSYLASLVVIVLISKNLWAENYYPSLFLFVVELILAYAYAPADTEEKPILSKKIRKRLKTSALFFVTFIFLFAIIIWHYDRTVYNTIVVSTLPVMFLLTPIGYKVLGCKQASKQI
jgi:accessory gene regulator B